jgi:hypothetical protein
MLVQFLLLFLLLNLFPELESSFKKELASRSCFSFMSLYVSIISPLILLWAIVGSFNFFILSGKVRRYIIQTIELKFLEETEVTYNYQILT